MFIFIIQYLFSIWEALLSGGKAFFFLLWNSLSLFLL